MVRLPAVLIEVDHRHAEQRPEAQREVRLFFAQARLLTDAPHMTHVVREGRTAFAHGPERVRVEEEEDDDDEAASDADASGDYIDPT